MSKPTRNEVASTETSAALPLFFKKPAFLELARHTKAGVLPLQDFTFTADTNSILVNGAEFFEAAKYYPIVFTEGEVPLPAIVLGLEQKNYYVDAEGKWKKGTYIPAYVRKHPFIFMDVPDQQQFLLCIDEASVQYKENGGAGTMPLYEEGKPSEVTRNALEFCTAFYNHHQITRRFCEDLKEAGLLMPTRGDAKLFNGREIHLGGFQVIDEKKLQELSDDKIIELHKKGWLPLIYFALMSGSNWRNLTEMAGESEQNAKTSAKI
jgi:hypothetical protein